MNDKRELKGLAKLFSRLGITALGDERKTHNIQLNFSTKGHTAVMVPVYAYGPGAGKVMISG